MWRVVIECGKVGGYKVAKHLREFTDRFKVWTHRNKVYAVFEVGSFKEVAEIRRELRRVKGLKPKFRRISRVRYERGY